MITTSGRKVTQAEEEEEEETVCVCLCICVGDCEYVCMWTQNEMGEPQIFDMIYELAHIHLYYSVREGG